MTTSQIIACAISWTAAIAAVAATALSLRAQQRARDILAAVRAERRTFAVPSGGEVTVTAPMSDAEYEAFKAAWPETYGQLGTAHPVDALDPDEAVCEAYRLPTTSENSGLCARCGMFDYKHHEARHV